jgi:hypothetical protein
LSSAFQHTIDHQKWTNTYGEQLFTKKWTFIVEPPVVKMVEEFVQPGPHELKKISFLLFVWQQN